MNKLIRIGKHSVRIVTTHRDYGSDCYRPGVRLFLTGPNGSVNGVGPKAWPGHMRVRRFRSDHAWAKTGWHRRNHGHYGWTDALYIPVPHIKWSTGYRLRRFGGLVAYQLVYRATSVLS